MTTHANKNNMANTRKSAWFNQDGSVRSPKILTVLPKTNNKGKIDPKSILPSFLKSANNLEKLADANKLEASQLIFGDNSLATLSDGEFFPGKKAAINDQNDIFYGSLTSYAGMLTSQVAQIDPFSLESFVLSKGKNAKTAAFVIPVKTVRAAKGQNKEDFKKYNVAARSTHKLHEFRDEVATVGTEAYVHQRLSNLSQLQRMTINMATGGNSKDSSKVLRVYENDFKERALGAVAEVGMSNYVHQNLALAGMLKTEHNQEAEQQKQDYTAARDELRISGSQEDFAELETARAVDEQKLAEEYQHAGTDANQLFRGYVGKVGDAVEKYSQSQTHYANLAAAEKAAKANKKK